MVIAIDGPAGAGKSTVARAVATELGYRYLDTGAMYRAVALAAIRAGVGCDDVDALASLAGVAATLSHDPELRSPQVDRSVSLVARHQPVREALHRAQRAYLAEGDAVAEGRDVGAVVWPEAELKIWLDAAPGCVRAGACASRATTRRRRRSPSATGATPRRRCAPPTRSRSTAPSSTPPR